MFRSYAPRMEGKAEELRLGVVMGLRKGLRLIRGMRRSLTEEEQHKIAGAIVEHLSSRRQQDPHGLDLFAAREAACVKGFGCCASSSFAARLTVHHTGWNALTPFDN
jgi:hypothetical protein